MWSLNWQLVSGIFQTHILSVSPWVKHIYIYTYVYIWQCWDLLATYSFGKFLFLMAWLTSCRSLAYPCYSAQFLLNWLHYPISYLAGFACLGLQALSKKVLDSCNLLLPIFTYLLPSWMSSSILCLEKACSSLLFFFRS